MTTTTADIKTTIHRSHFRRSSSLIWLAAALVVTLLTLQPQQKLCVAWTVTPTLLSQRYSGTGTIGNTALAATRMYIDNANIHKDSSSVLSQPRRQLPYAAPQPTITISNHNTGRQLPPPPKHYQQQHQHELPSKINGNVVSTHGMPWQKSISEQYNTDNQAAATTGLFYMKFYEWQISYMKQALTNLKQLPVVSKKGQRDMSYVQNANATMRMHTSAYTSDEYKYIRCTTVDGGNQLQVFTSLFYPRDTLLPVLGVDLLQFNHGKKTLCIVDFQPVVVIPSSSSSSSSTDGDAATPNKHYNTEYYESKLKLIRDQYPSLQNEMTNRFYSADDPYFSKQMLLGRVQHDGKTNTIDDTKAATLQMVQDDLYPAYQQYVQTHVQLQKEAQQHNKNVADESYAQKCHAQYDTYSAERDPAHKLLGNIFGPDFANDYVYDILFPSATRTI